jgi:hypothetical protein
MVTLLLGVLLMAGCESQEKRRLAPRADDQDQAVDVNVDDDRVDVRIRPKGRKSIDIHIDWD